MYSRRSVVGTVVGAAVLVVLWTLRGFVGSPSVRGTDSELRAGTTSTIEVEASNVGGLVFSSLPEETSVRLELSRAAVSPRPSSVVDTYPPFWYWRIPKQSVSVSVPVSAPDEAEPGEYRYAVRAYGSADRDAAASVTEEFAIGVVDE